VTASAGRRRPSKAVRLVLAAGVITAITQCVQRQEWLSAAVLAVLMVLAGALPVARAAIGRAAERDADAFAATSGAGGDLASALATMRRAEPQGWVARLLAHHPDVTSRIESLTAPSGSSG
jgi:Zn-dependent protease with chaperone function